MNRFRERYFSPWTTKKALYPISQAQEGMTTYAGKVWYGENRMKVDPKRLDALLKLAALDRIPSMNQLGIIITPTFVRGLPSSTPLYESGDDFPFDQIQYSGLKQNEPVRIIHASADGAWLYIEASSASGWVEPGAVRLADEAFRQRMLDSQQVAVVTDFTLVRDEAGKVLAKPKTGTLYPLLKEESEYWLVALAVAGEGDNAVIKNARIEKNAARRHPLPFSAENLTLLGNELLKSRYGWGDLFQNRDCSSTTRDFFLPFGIWLPRNSMQQINSGNAIQLSGLSPVEKEKIILQKGVPFLTLLHLKGHIMLYVGSNEGKPIVLHNTWSVKYKGEKNQMERRYIGRTVLTTLELGKELPLINGTLLDKLQGMLILGSNP